MPLERNQRAASSLSWSIFNQDFLKFNFLPSLLPHWFTSRLPTLIYTRRGAGKKFFTFSILSIIMMDEKFRSHSMECAVRLFLITCISHFHRWLACLLSSSFSQYHHDVDKRLWASVMLNILLVRTKCFVHAYAGIILFN